ncbi:MAG TPA: MBL fold metallo-hydrolase [Ignavibacteriales bacterium]|nr:MBL fold metallo-hydrolase [Ignavibacteriales bacterium]HOL80486.1 MBL fold metallo-hydrolase [Ignavibacteriales bacterium]HOM64937.1 MBL fold metallo-hydrolase [Ignavibacteriales bacterium]HPD67958.1 MBL fold metallo-hydrolase [Ignavibacteriales bacterium]HPP32676.1 MBL fold metallo-hydrolase [Ignavibacteriales bacterium]
MQIQFIGAARTVTGSMHQITLNGTKFLIDCGLYQGKRKEAFELNKRLDYIEPEELDFVILTHAHTDHAGNLPSLVKAGFRGNIYCTSATRDLCAVMLRDTQRILERDVEYINKRRIKRGQNPFEVLYSAQDVENTIKMMVAINYDWEMKISPKLKLTFYDAGHILGSAIVHLRYKISDNEERIIVFSGDLGRKYLPILKDPEQIKEADYLIMEATYGGRFHADYQTTEQRLKEIIKEAIQKKSKIIIPSFSVGRSQELVYALNELFKKYPKIKIPVYVDSPLSVHATEVFKLHPECYDDETMKYLLEGKDPFGFHNLTYITEVEESKKLNDMQGPMMIISSSGMAEAGRIVHHLYNNIENPNNIILIVGYNAEHTLGRKIVEGVNPVRILGDEKQLNAKVVVLNSLSAHADSNEILDYVSHMNLNRLKKVFLVHGDYEQQLKLAERLKQIGIKEIEIPAKGEVYQLD